MLGRSNDGASIRFHDLRRIGLEGSTKSISQRCVQMHTRTTDANEVMKSVHARMPVILGVSCGSVEQFSYNEWLQNV